MGSTATRRPVANWWSTGRPSSQYETTLGERRKRSRDAAGERSLMAEGYNRRRLSARRVEVRTRVFGPDYVTLFPIGAPEDEEEAGEG